MAEPAVLEARSVSKRFGALAANDRVSFAVRAGQIHALLGENGAGKSTLVKILYGAYQPDAGELRWRGRPTAIASPAAARALGIDMVFQHFSLFESLSVADNLALGTGAAGAAALRERLAAIASEHGLALDMRAAVAELSAGERQRLEIVRCLLLRPQVLILDEPTSVLTAQEARKLFALLRRLARGGCAVIYISHRLKEVRELCDRATILRKGRVVGDVNPRSCTPAELARLMIGAELGAARRPAHRAPGPVRLEVRDLQLAAPAAAAVALGGIDFEVAGGQILAIAGIAGNGQSELFAALSGERPAAQAECVKLDGRPVGTASITQRRRLNAAFVPEQRLGHGAVPQHRLSDNVVLSRHATERRIKRGGLLAGAVARAIAGRVRGAFGVRAQGADPIAGALSGGNLQKFIVGREIDRQPGVLIVNQPTWGVDANAAVTIRNALRRLAGAGAAIVVISQDLDELLEIADRIAVIADGRLSAPIAAARATPELLGALMGGRGANAGAH